MKAAIQQIAPSVSAELARVAQSDPALAQVIQDRIGPESMWTSDTIEVIRREERLGTDGRAG
jgi:hypothetical protein